METIGEKLKAARLDRGLTIGDLQKITKIQRRYLEAIEDNDFDAMPSDYYTRTFIRQFAEAVGLNPKPLLRRLDGKPEEENKGLSNTMILSLPVRGSRKSKYNETNSKKTTIKSYIPVTLLVLVVLAIVGTITWAIMLDSEKGPIVPKPEKTTVVQGSNSSTEASSEKETDSSEKTSESSTTDSTKEEKKKKKEKSSFALESDTGDLATYTAKNVKQPVKVTFKGLEGPAWVGLQSTTTQELFYQYTIQPGEELETIAPEGLESLDIIVGAANNVKISVNGEQLKFNEKTPVTGKKMITLKLNSATTNNSIEEKEVNR
ncbi:RodZ domain-containing protein [Vagococcus hydrophili]|uniref:Helix-turn-helix domain-containing protein n=1 Tax=Vagococcus hydrophili TaxID=2714947 RepID=A0A6G8AT80_9ENTE|nr:RodZ domain-containing protein [Vagococcus hydrophili]QIL48206.1 helix-turn-helix domain-containing protein [Vagococcus hydrophili]